MPYTIQCRGRVLGTTSLEFDEFVPGQHSGYLEPGDGAQHLLDAVAVGFPNLLTWLMRDTTLPNGASFASPKFLASGECQAIAEAVAARVHLVLSLHREDGTELPTSDIVLQDREYWDMPWLEAELDACLTDQQRAEIDAAVEHDVALLREWHPEWFDGSADAVDDLPFESAGEPEPVGLRPRYLVHLRLLNPTVIECSDSPLAEESQ